MMDTSRYFMVVSAVISVATFAAAFAESSDSVQGDVSVLAVPASQPAALPLATVSPVANDQVVAEVVSAETAPEETVLTVAMEPPLTEAPPAPARVEPPPRTEVPRVKESAPTKPEVDLDELALKLHGATNRARIAEGLSPLQYDATLAANATAYSRRMQREEFLGHTDPQGCALTCRFQKSGYEALAWGENLARWRSSYDPDVDELATYFMREWLRSDGHRDNILSPDFTVQGIGYAIEGGEVFVTVHFADPL